MLALIKEKPTSFSRAARALLCSSSLYSKYKYIYAVVSSKGDWWMNHYVEQAKQNVLTRLDEENLMTALVGVLVSPAGWQEE